MYIRINEYILIYFFFIVLFFLLLFFFFLQKVLLDPFATLQPFNFLHLARFFFTLLQRDLRIVLAIIYCKKKKINKNCNYLFHPIEPTNNLPTFSFYKYQINHQNQLVHLQYPLLQLVYLKH